MQLPCRGAGDIQRRAKRRHVLANQHEPGRDEMADAGEKIGRGAIVYRHDDDAREQTPPEGDYPFGTVLAPEDDLVPLAQSELMQPGREAAGGPSDLRVCMRAASKS